MLAVLPLDPSAALLEDPAREVPAAEVFALEDTAPEALTADSTVPPAAGEGSAVATLPLRALVEPALLDCRVELEAAGAATPAVAEGLKSPLPVTATAPAPAPEDEPAVFDAVPAEEL